MLLVLKVAAVALVHGARRARHSLREFRRHQRLANYPIPRGRRPPLKGLCRAPSSPSHHQRRSPTSPVETTLCLRHHREYPPLRHKRRRSARRVLPRLPNHHQRRGLDPARRLYANRGPIMIPLAGSRLVNIQCQRTRTLPTRSPPGRNLCRPVVTGTMCACTLLVYLNVN